MQIKNNFLDEKITRILLDLQDQFKDISSWLEEGEIEVSQAAKRATYLLVEMAHKWNIEYTPIIERDKLGGCHLVKISILSGRTLEISLDKEGNCYEMSYKDPKHDFSCKLVAKDDFSLEDLTHALVWIE